MMTFLALKKFWSFARHYWYLPVIVVAFIVALVVLRRKPEGLGNILGNAVESHRKEVEVLNKTHAEEIVKRDKALSIYHTTIEQVQNKFAVDQKILDSKKKKEIKRIIEENQDDPEALAERISEYTGFKVIMPEE